MPHARMLGCLTMNFSSIAFLKAGLLPRSNDNILCAYTPPCDFIACQDATAKSRLLKSIIYLTNLINHKVFANN